MPIDSLAINLSPLTSKVGFNVGQFLHSFIELEYIFVIAIFLEPRHGVWECIRYARNTLRIS